ncbi:LytR/AlgR family response regulator transcription factor [Carboxylicivirga sp. N1Y90]|uniref:LytR/AlgR family response regulator transcription factor n=1 Tax=Carboxylicivirga fragile TaxID=3417571 RepID=UPI003D33E2DD|nr:LytTR family transcriptional regulator [Marinilabiliaceae bacterium N1Y90]
MASNKTLQILFTAIGIGLFVAYVLIVFQPFGTDDFRHPNKNLFLAGYGAIITCSYVIIYLLFDHLIRPRLVLIGIWSWVFEAVLLVTTVLLSLTASFFYHHWFIGSQINWFTYFGFLILGGSISIIPIAIIIVLRYQLKNRNIQRTINKEKKEEVQLVLSSNNKSDEDVKLTPSTLVYVMANGNYTEVYQLEGDELKRIMLRNSLSNIQQQLPEHHFMKVHRSYIVNVRYLEKVYTQQSNYFLLLSVAKVEIPLSRNAISEVRQLCTK